MFNEFIVKVNRYWSDESGSQGWDGWFYSKVYAIEGNEFLVYDDGSMSAWNTEEDYCEDGFVWVDFTEAIPRCGGKGYEMRVTPYTADTPQTDSEITRNSLRTDCNGCRFTGWYDTEFPCVNCIRKNKGYYDAEQTDCGWK